MADALLPRFPGSKRRYLAKWYDGGRYDCAIAPFMGSARWEVFWADKVQALFSADADRSVQACWQAWQQAEIHNLVYSEINKWKEEFSTCDPSSDPSNLGEIWASLKERHETLPIGGMLAAVTLVLRQLTFGGVVRESAQKPGVLNIKWEAGQLAKLSRWSYRFPPVLRVPFYFERDYLDCIRAFEESDYQNAIALIDPPYYANRVTGTRMTAAYPGHKPHAPETLAFFTNSVERLAATRRVSRMIITGYFDADIDEALFAISKEFSLPFERRTVGKLDGINQSRQHSTDRVECEWELGHRSTVQLSLLSAIA